MDYRICVYAICKDEEKFVDRWMRSMREADWVVALDTGSSDDTVRRLEELGARVDSARIAPWRFDAARNRSMALIPEEADICVCTDLDEEFEPGWSGALRRAWSGDVTQARYRYTWNFEADGSEGVVFYPEKIHRNGGFRWVGPVHEVLKYEGAMPEKIVTAHGVQLNHRADPGKSRGQYLPLLELAVAENPNDDRSAHYLGREYMFHGMWQASIDQLTRHLAMPGATWKDERCASMRFIARDCLAMGDLPSAEAWLMRAAAEAGHLREPWVELARLLYEKGDWAGVCFAAGRALAILTRPESYICDAEAWGALPWDLRAVARYRMGLGAQALQDAQMALSLAPHDTRLLENVRLLGGAPDGAALP